LFTFFSLRSTLDEKSSRPRQTASETEFLLRCIERTWSSPPKKIKMEPGGYPYPQLVFCNTNFLFQTNL